MLIVRWRSGTFEKRILVRRYVDGGAKITVVRSDAVIGKRRETLLLDASELAALVKALS